jgi:Myb-like DNA-binding domain
LFDKLPEETKESEAGVGIEQAEQMDTTAPLANETEISPAVPTEVLVKREVKTDEDKKQVELTENGDIIIRSIVPDVKIPKPKGAPYHPHVIPPWSTEEDDAVWSLASHFSYNWALISQTMRSMRIGTFMKRTDWDCYERFLQILPTHKSKKPRDFLYSAPCKSNTAVLHDNKCKALKMISLFEKTGKLNTAAHVEKSD